MEFFSILAIQQPMLTLLSSFTTVAANYPTSYTCADIKSIYQGGLGNSCCGADATATVCDTRTSEFDFGFPKCYPTVTDARARWIASTKVNRYGTDYAASALLGGTAMMPYANVSASECVESNKYLAAVLSPHFSPIGIVVYRSTTRTGALHSRFHKNVLVAGVGSWHTLLGSQHTHNGQTIVAFKMGGTYKQEALEQLDLIPHLNNDSTYNQNFELEPGWGLSPTDVHQSASGALLFTSKRGEYVGLMAVTETAPISPVFETIQGHTFYSHMLEAGDHRRCTSILVSAEEWIVCTHQYSKRITARTLSTDYTVSTPFTLVVNTGNSPDGIVIHNNVLYYATLSDILPGSGVWKISDISTKLTSGAAVAPEIFERDHLYLRPRHNANALHISDDGQWMFILQGNPNNWSPQSTGYIVAKSMSTGTVYTFATSVRNPTGMTQDGDTLYISQMGSDQGFGTYDAEGVFAPSCSVLSVPYSQWKPDTLAPKNTDIDDRGGVLAVMGTSCTDLVTDVSTCGNEVPASVTWLPSSSFVYVMCPKACKSYIEGTLAIASPSPPPSSESGSGA